MKILTLAIVCAAGVLFNTGCASCHSCCKPATAACTKCCTDAAGCAKCCHKS